jgi:hypothetical protein
MPDALDAALGCWRWTDRKSLSIYLTSGRDRVILYDMQTQFRQGDVLVERIGRTVKFSDHQPVDPVHGRLILAHGEATGHTHSVASEDAVMVLAADGTLLLDVLVETPLTHQEHDAIPLPVGRYRVTRQREYAPEAIRNVSD